MYIGDTTNFNQRKHNHKTILYQKQTFIYECGSEVRCSSKAQHLRSNKDKIYLVI
jgi:hypothetical protein